MDEAERCHRLAYIAYGKLLASGTLRDVLAVGPALRPGKWPGAALGKFSQELKGPAGIEQVTAFGNDSHVSSRDGAALEQRHRALPARDRHRWQQSSPDWKMLSSASCKPRRIISMQMMPTLVLTCARLCGDHSQGVHPDAAGPPDLRHDVRHPHHPTRSFSASPSTPIRRACRSPSSRPTTARLRGGLCHALENSGYFTHHRTMSRTRGGRARLLAQRRSAVRGQHPGGLFRAGSSAASEPALARTRPDATDPSAVSSAVQVINEITRTVFDRDLAGPLQSMVAKSGPGRSAPASGVQPRPRDPVQHRRPASWGSS